MVSSVQFDQSAWSVYAASIDERVLAKLAEAERRRGSGGCESTRSSLPCRSGSTRG
jgi:hypothetical protein